ncbi:MAG: hypothetical protein ACSHXH_16915 [Marivita sp.]|uniref:hypothetical protein n=1 Tax=Marivita sp. TaxID=2003365 RepID=UPI003EF41A0F
MGGLGAEPPELYQAALALYRAAPYHDINDAGHIIDPVRADAGLETKHPLMRAYLDARVCRSYSRDHVREHVIPAYWA